VAGRGAAITDIRPVDAAGRPLSGVYLFDQDGRPLDVGRPCDAYDPYDGYDADGGTGSTDPYPRGSAGYDDETGECTVVPPAPLVVAVPSATASAAPTPSAPPTPPAPPASVLPRAHRARAARAARHGRARPEPGATHRVTSASGGRRSGVRRPPAPPGGRRSTAG
jgi:hypothetical protein